MKQLGKRLLVLLLVVSMMLSVMPLSVFAEPDQSDQLIEQVQQNTERQTEQEDDLGLLGESDNNDEPTEPSSEPTEGMLTMSKSAGQDETKDDTSNDQQPNQVMQVSPTEPTGGASLGDYLAWNGEDLVVQEIPQTAEKFSSLKSVNDVYTLHGGKTYVLDETISEPEKSLWVIGFEKVTLILMDDRTLTVKNIRIDNTKGIEICGQSGNTGTLIADGTNAKGIPGIGVAGVKLWGNPVIGIYGGNIEAAGGQSAAGIGAAPSTKWGYNADLTINIAGNAKVTAKGYAGLGGGKEAEASAIKVNVTMKAGDIVPELTVTGEAKAINAEKDNIAFDLGEGYAFKSGDDETTAEICEDPSLYAEKAVSSPFVSIDKTAVQNTVDADGQALLTLNESAFEGETYMAYDFDKGQYVEKPIPADAVPLSKMRPITTRGFLRLYLPVNRVYVLDSDITEPTLQIYPESNSGSITIILKDGCTAKVRTVAVAYRQSGLYIYGQKNNTGTLIADASEESGSPGIGTPYQYGIGGYTQESGPIYIFGGTIEAYGGQNAAGIGGNGSADGNRNARGSGPINIFGGKITAVGGTATPRLLTGFPNGAGIGSGAMGENIGPINIHGGEVTATSGSNLINPRATAAIGCGHRYHYVDNRINITGGTVSASTGLGGGAAAAIGTGSYTWWARTGESHIFIGGDADVTAISDYAPIGIGDHSESSPKTSVDIEGAKVKVLAMSKNEKFAINAQNVNIKDISTLEYKDKLDADWVLESNPNQYVNRAKTKTAIQINENSGEFPIPYIDPQEKVPEKQCNNARLITAATRELKRNNGADGWYYVDDTVNIPDSLTVPEWNWVNIILKDGCTLNVNEIKLNPHAFLKVYSQEGNSGQLNAKVIYGDGNGTDRGGGRLIGLYGGQINVTGSDGYPGIGFKNSTINTIEINRAAVTATGGNGYPGIGVFNTIGNRIWIDGGTVKATAGNGNAPGIGAIGGLNTWIRIRGGDITAQGSGNAPGIGGSNAFSIEMINITSEKGESKIKAIGGGNKAIGIINGNLGNNKLVINSEQVLVGSSEGAALQSPYLKRSENITGVQRNKVALINYKNQYSPVSYVDKEGKEATCERYRLIESGTTILDAQDEVTKGWYVVNDDVALQEDLTVAPYNQVNVILTDGCTLDAKRIKLSTHAFLNVYAQTGNTGELKAERIYADNGLGVQIGLYGGQIQVTGSDVHPGIGFNGGYFNTVEIIRANVTSTGIGGINTLTNRVFIRSGKVNATGSDNAPGIGFINGLNNQIEITGGDIIAQGDSYAPGIGGNLALSIGKIMIQLGDQYKLKATGGWNTAIGVSLGNLGSALNIISDFVLVGSSQEAAQQTAYLKRSENGSKVQRNKVALINYPTDYTAPRQSMTIGDRMTVNLTTVIPKEGRNDSGRMTFNISGLDSSPVTVWYKDVAVIEEDDKDDTIAVTFPCPIRPDQMADIITAEYRYSDDGQDKFIKYDLMTAEAYLLEVMKDNNATQETKDFAYALGQYGYHAQHELWAIKSWTFGPGQGQHREITYFNDTDILVPEGTYEKYTIKGNHVPDNISITSLGFTLESAFSFNVNIRDRYDADCIGRYVTVRLGNKVIPSNLRIGVDTRWSWRLRIPQINVMNWSDELTITATLIYRNRPSQTWTLSLSPMTFGNYVRQGDQLQRKMMDAVWNLNQKALNYYRKNGAAQ